MYRILNLRNIVIKILVFCYFPLYFITYEISKTVNINHGIIFITVAGIYLLFSFVLLYEIIAFHKKLIINSLFIPYLFFTFLSFLVPDSKGIDIPSFIIISSSFIFFFLLVSANDKNELASIFRTLELSIFFCFFLFFIPLSLKGSFTVGGFYGITKIPFINTSLDPPLLTGILFLWVFINLENSLKNKKLSVIIFQFAALIFFGAVMMVMSRRGPLLFALFLIIYILKPKIFANKVVLIVMVSFMVLPIIFWKYIIIIFEKIPSNLIESMFRESSMNSFVTASNRLDRWMHAPELVTHFKLKNLIFNYNILDSYFKSKGPYGHFHNGFLQLTYETGVINLIVTILLVYYTFLKINNLNINYRNNTTIMKISIIFLYILILSMTESTFRNNKFSHQIFLVSILFIDRLHLLSKENLLTK